MSKLKFTLANLFLWVTLALGCFYVENLAILTNDMKGGFDFSCFWLLTIGCFASMGMYFYLEHKRNKLKLDKILFTCLMTIFVIMLFTIWAQTGETFRWANSEGENVVSFTLYQKITYSFMLLFVILSTYIILYVMFARRASPRTLLFIAVIYLAYTYFTMIFSLIKEPQIFVGLFENRMEGVKAFYHNPNTFGMAIFVAILTCFVINYYKPNVFTYISIFVFLIFDLFTYCATSILLSSASILLYFIIDIAKNAHKKLFKTVIISSISLLIFVFGVIFIFALGMTNDPFMAKINNMLSELFKTFNTKTLSGRTFNWPIILKACIDSPWHLLFGRGFMTSNQYMPAMLSAGHNVSEGGSPSGENGFLFIFYEMGLFGLILYFLICAYFIYCCIRLFMRRKFSFASLYLLCFAANFIYNFFEVNLFFDMGIKESYVTILFFMPPIVMHKHYIHKKETKLMLATEINKPSYQPEKIAQIISIVLLSLAGAFYTPILLNNSLETEAFSKICLYVSLGCLVGLLFVPYLVYLWIKDNQKTTRMIHLYVNIIGLFAVFALTYLFASFFNSSSATCLLWAIIIGATTLVVDFIIYVLVRKDFLKKYLSITFIEPCKIIAIPLLIGVISSQILGLIFRSQYPLNALTCLIIVVLSLIFMEITLFLLPFKTKNNLFDYLNNHFLYNYRQYLKRGE